jgi:hypothetical protein
MLLAGVQQFKELDSGQKPAGMTKEEFHPFVVTLGVMRVRRMWRDPNRGFDLSGIYHI